MFVSASRNRIILYLFRTESYGRRDIRHVGASTVSPLWRAPSACSVCGRVIITTIHNTRCRQRGVLPIAADLFSRCYYHYVHLFRRIESKRGDIGTAGVYRGHLPVGIRVAMTLSCFKINISCYSLT